MSFHDDFFNNDNTNQTGEYSKIREGAHAALIDNVEIDTTNADRCLVKITWQFKGSKRLAWQNIPFSDKTGKLSAWQCRELGIWDELKAKLEGQEKPPFSMIATSAYNILCKKLQSEHVLECKYRSYTNKKGEPKEALDVIIKNGEKPLANLLEDPTTTKAKEMFNASEEMPF